MSRAISDSRNGEAMRTPGVIAPAYITFLSAAMEKRRYPAPTHSARLLVRLDSSSGGLFRFLLEAWDNLAGFTVLDRNEALLQVFFSPHQEEKVRLVLAIISTEIPLTVMPWPVREMES
jgi:hypothetical protein